MKNALRVAMITALLSAVSFNANADRHKDGGEHSRRGGMLEAVDANKDGKVTRDELNAAHEKRVNAMFEKMDTNKDGAIDTDERQATKAAWHKTKMEKAESPDE